MCMYVLYIFIICADSFPSFPTTRNFFFFEKIHVYSTNKFIWSNFSASSQPGSASPAIYFFSSSKFVVLFF